MAEGIFTTLAFAPREDGGEESESRLTFMSGGWAGAPREHGVSRSVILKVQTFLEARPSIMHLDELINKKDHREIRYLMLQLLKHRSPIQVAFLQGALPLQSDELFPRLLDLLRQCPVWSVNLGELRFSEEQCAQLANALRVSGVTHLFYECTVAGQWKETYRYLIRANRQKHGLWRLGPDAEQNRVIFASVKNWFVATSHTCNKEWVGRNAGGWTQVGRLQCEACGKWRRLPPSLHGWPCAFYCAMNTWDRRYSTCEAAEEAWDRDVPMAGDTVACELCPGLWLDGRVETTPKLAAWPSLPRVGLPPPPPPSEAEAQLAAAGPTRVDQPPTVVGMGGRQRKRPASYDASVSSTEYTRLLRQREREEEALRKASVTVAFTDGATRCVRLEQSGKGEQWVMPHEASSAMARVRKAHPPPPPPLESGQLVLCRVDGKAWRRLQLVRPMSQQEASEVEATRAVAPSEGAWWHCTLVGAARRRRTALLVELSEETRAVLWQRFDASADYSIALLSEQTEEAEDGEEEEEEEMDVAAGGETAAQGELAERATATEAVVAPPTPPPQQQKVLHKQKHRVVEADENAAAVVVEKGPPAKWSAGAKRGRGNEETADAEARAPAKATPPSESPRKASRGLASVSLRVRGVP